jgi:hypothetical protein
MVESEAPETVEHLLTPTELTALADLRAEMAAETAGPDGWYMRRSTHARGATGVHDGWLGFIADRHTHERCVAREGAHPESCASRRDAGG